MRPLLLVPLAAVLLVLPAAADGRSDSGVRLRGTVTARDVAQGRISVTSARIDHVLRISRAVRPIRIGMRVDLRGTTLRRHGDGSRVLALGVTVVSSTVRGAAARDDEADDDELEVRGRIASLAPLTVAGATCAVPTGVTLAGFAVGDLVEMTCDLVRGQWVLRELESEDDDEDEDLDEDDDDHSGPGGGDDEEDEDD